MNKENISGEQLFHLRCRLIKKKRFTLSLYMRPCKSLLSTTTTNPLIYIVLYLIVMAAPPLDASFCFKTVLLVTTIVRI